jgi:hypothetical protein
VWVKLFQDRWEDVTDKERCGHSVTSKTDPNLEKVPKMVSSHSRLSGRSEYK